MTCRAFGLLAAVTGLAGLAPLSAVAQASTAAAAMPAPTACQAVDYLEPPIGAAAIVIDQLEGQAAIVPVGSRHGMGAVIGLCVVLFSPGTETPMAVATTDERGRFEFARPEPGSYVLMAARESLHDLAVTLLVSDVPPHPEVERGLLLRVRVEEDDRRSSASVIRHLALRRELLEMGRVDQAVRNELIRRGVGTPDPELLSRMASVDAGNTVRLQAIVEEHGSPGADLVGTDGAGAAFLILQHASHDVQKELFPRVEAGYREGTVPGPSYALLLDRILVGEGEPQVYGSQAKSLAEWIDGEPALEPIEDEAGVDVRRAEVGLPPLAEYRELLKRLYLPER